MIFLLMTAITLSVPRYVLFFIAVSVGMRGFVVELSRLQFDNGDYFLVLCVLIVIIYQFG